MNAGLHPMTFNFVRLVVGVTFLAPIVYIMKITESRANLKATTPQPSKEPLLRSKSDDGVINTTGASSSSALAKFLSSPTLDKPLSFKFSIIGVFLSASNMTLASSLQQWGLSYTSAGMAGFITGMFVVLTPLIGLFLGQKTTLISWVSGASHFFCFPLFSR
jgi:drug/metabolite transporter (DMT)-like permease